MCRRTSVRRSIYGVGTRLRATLVWRLLRDLFREEEQRSSGRSISSEVEAPRSSGPSASRRRREWTMFGRTLRRTVGLVWRVDSSESVVDAHQATICMQIGCIASSEAVRTRTENSASVGDSGTIRIGQCETGLRSRETRTPWTLRSLRELVLTGRTALRRRIGRVRSEWNVRKATAVVTRCGCGRGESFEGCETRCGKLENPST